jgi:hypothetical protein
MLASARVSNGEEVHFGGGITYEAEWWCLTDGTYGFMWALSDRVWYSYSHFNHWIRGDKM